MTEELKQKAENYLNNYLNTTKMGTPIGTNCLREAYIAGATENGVHWHDLRKDPNDLPNEEKDVLVYSGEQWRMSVCRYFPQHKAWEAGSDTIAWCEIPQFKE